MKTQNQIIEQGYQALVNSLGVVDAIRFVQHFNPGYGNYTAERHQWLDRKSIDDLLEDIEQLGQNDDDRDLEVIE
ncbi:MAG: hypothetical protein AAFR63_09070 [Cyanobacteria bacterium J06631_6]